MEKKLIKLILNGAAIKGSSQLKTSSCFEWQNVETGHFIASELIDKFLFMFFFILLHECNRGTHNNDKTKY